MGPSHFNNIQQLGCFALARNDGETIVALARNDERLPASRFQRLKQSLDFRFCVLKDR
jgi:hypothetical protein